MCYFDQQVSQRDAPPSAGFRALFLSRFGGLRLVLFTGTPLTVTLATKSSLDDGREMKHFDSIEFGDPSAGDARTFLDGSTRSYTVLHTAVIGIGTYLPGWKWSLHAKPQTGKTSERHIGYIVSGSMMVEDSSGN